jgi:hypothetical protein
MKEENGETWTWKGKFHSLSLPAMHLLSEHGISCYLVTWKYIHIDTRLLSSHIALGMKPATFSKMANYSVTMLHHHMRMETQLATNQ